MLYAMQLSTAQQRVVNFINAGGLIIDTTKHINGYRIYPKTLLWLMENGIIELVGDKYISTKLGKTLDRHGWVDPIPKEKKFGYTNSLLKHKLKDEIIAENWKPKRDDIPFNIALSFEVNKRVELLNLQKRNSPDINNKSITKTNGKNIHFTTEEIYYLKFLLEYSNNETSQSIMRKLSNR